MPDLSVRESSLNQSQNLALASRQRELRSVWGCGNTELKGPRETVVARCENYALETGSIAGVRREYPEDWSVRTIGEDNRVQVAVSYSFFEGLRDRGDVGGPEMG